MLESLAAKMQMMTTGFKTFCPNEQNSHIGYFATSAKIALSLILTQTLSLSQTLQ